MIKTLARVFPDFRLFDLAEQAGHEGGVNAALALRAAAYALTYVFVFGFLAVYSFRRREI